MFQGLFLPFAEFNGIDGFIGFRGSLMLDVVFLAMFAVVPVMLWSIYQVRYHRRFQLHKTTQIVLGVVLLVAVLLFEIDMRINGWIDRAKPSPFWKDGAFNDWIDASLMIHLACAIPTAVLWIVVIVRALRQFPKPPLPGEHSRSHIFWVRDRLASELSSRNRMLFESPVSSSSFFDKVPIFRRGVEVVRVVQHCGEDRTSIAYCRDTLFLPEPTMRSQPCRSLLVVLTVLIAVASRAERHLHAVLVRACA